MMRTRRKILKSTTLGLLFVCACAHQPDQATSHAPSTSVPKDEIAIENLLRWPLIGPQGAQRVAAVLQQVFAMESLQASQLYGKGPARLPDEHVLSFAWIRQRSNSIDIGIAVTPCFAAERAISITGAAVEPAVIDQHGADHGDKYQVERNGVSLRFETGPRDRRCVTDIHINPSRR